MVSLPSLFIFISIIFWLVSFAPFFAYLCHCYCYCYCPRLNRRLRRGLPHSLPNPHRLSHPRTRAYHSLLHHPRVFSAFYFHHCQHCCVTSVYYHLFGTAYHSFDFCMLPLCLPKWSRFRRPCGTCRGQSTSWPPLTSPWSRAPSSLRVPESPTSASFAVQSPCPSPCTSCPSWFGRGTRARR